MKNRILGLLIATCAVAVLTSASSFGQAVAQAGQEISAANSRNQETAVGNLVVDAVKAATNAEGAILPASSLTGTGLASGQLDTENLKAVLTDPTDQIVVLNLTGAQLKSALERSAGMHPRPFAGFLQVSGIRFTVTASAKAGARVSDIRLNNQLVQPAQKIRIATVSSLAGGALGYFQIWDKSAVTLGDGPILDAVVAYARKAGTLAPRKEGRIVVK